MNKLYTAAYIGILFLLTGCGFQLRQPVHLPAAMQRTYISDNGNDVQLVRGLSHNLTTSKITVVEDANQATAIFNILSAKRMQRILSVSNTGQPLQYQVAYQVQFSIVTASGKTLLKPQKLTLTREYTYSTSNQVSNIVQANALFKALTDQMVQLIMFRLEAINLNHKQKA